MTRQKPRHRGRIASRKPDAPRRLRIEVLELRTVLSGISAAAFVTHDGGPMAISLPRPFAGPLPELREAWQTISRTLDSAASGDARGMAIVPLPQSSELSANVFGPTQPTAWGLGEQSRFVVIPGSDEALRFFVELPSQSAEPISPVGRALADMQAEGGLVDIAVPFAAERERAIDALSSTPDLPMMTPLRFGLDAADASPESESPARLRSGIHISGVEVSGLAMEASSLPLRVPQADPASGDGLTAFENLTTEAHAHPAERPAMASEAPAAARPAAPPSGGNVAYGLLGMEASQPNSAANREKTSGAAARAEELPQAAKDASSFGGTPSVAAPAGESRRAADPTAIRAGSSRPDSAATIDGDTIAAGIAPEPQSPLSRTSQQTSLASRPRVLEKADAGKSLLPRTGDAEHRDPARLAADDDQLPATASIPYELSQEAARDSGPSCDRVEGGMIELAAATAPASPSGSAAVAATAADDRQAAEVKEIRMDSGVAQFHAFELATAPVQESDASDAASTGASESAPLPDMTAPSPPLDSAAADEAVSAEKTSATGPVQGARVAQAIGVALGMFAIRRIRREDKRAERR